MRIVITYTEDVGVGNEWVSTTSTRCVESQVSIIELTNKANFIAKINKSTGSKQQFFGLIPTTGIPCNDHVIIEIIQSIDDWFDNNKYKMEG